MSGDGSNESGPESNLDWEKAYQVDDSSLVADSDKNLKAAIPEVQEQPEEHGKLRFGNLEKAILVGSVAIFLIWRVWDGTSAYGWVGPFVSDIPTRVLRITITGLGAVILGIGFVAPYFLWRSKQLTEKWFSAPGDWLIAVIAFGSLQGLPVSIWLLAAEFELDDLLFWNEVAHSFKWTIIVLASLFALWAVVKCQGLPWKFLFLVLMVPTLFIESACAYLYVETVTIMRATAAWPLLGGFLLLFALDVDRSRNLKRDWFHKLGVCVAVIFLLVIPALMLVLSVVQNRL